MAAGSTSRDLPRRRAPAPFTSCGPTAVGLSGSRRPARPTTGTARELRLRLLTGASSAFSETYNCEHGNEGFIDAVSNDRRPPHRVVAAVHVPEGRRSIRRSMAPRLSLARVCRIRFRRLGRWSAGGFGHLRFIVREVAPTAHSNLRLPPRPCRGRPRGRAMVNGSRSPITIPATSGSYGATGQAYGVSLIPRCTRALRLWLAPAVSG